MDRSGEERNANWRGESDRTAGNRERDDWQQSGNWRNRTEREADRNAQRAAAQGQPSPFRETWGNSDGFSESFYNRAMSPYESSVGGLEVRESHWPAPERGAAVPANANWPEAPPRSAASAAAEAQRDTAREDRWARQQGEWGNAPSWSNRHAGIADTTWGGGGHMNQRERDWGDVGSSWSRGAAAREWGSQPDWSSRAAAEGPFRGRGPQGYQRSDERIREDICDLLTERGDVDATEVQVLVRNREVILEGAVPDRRMKRVAEDIAETTRGVRDVHNHLRVASDLEAARSWPSGDWRASSRSSSREHAGRTDTSRRDESDRSAAGRRSAADRSGKRESSRSVTRESERSTRRGSGRSAADREASRSMSRESERSAPGRASRRSTSREAERSAAGRESKRSTTREAERTGAGRETRRSISREAERTATGREAERSAAGRESRRSTTRQSSRSGRGAGRESSGRGRNR